MKLGFFVVSAIVADSVDDLGNKKNSKCHCGFSLNLNKSLRREAKQRSWQGFHMHEHMDVHMQFRR